MFRSLLSLMLLASMNMGAPLALVPTNSFDLSELLAVNRIPLKHSDAAEPVIEAESAIVLDNDTGVTLYEKNSDQVLPMASLTKIMTAVIILDNHNLNEVITVKRNFSGERIGVRIWLHQYEKMTVGDLLIGLLVRSGGDAALTLAEHHSGSVEAFVGAMNEKARILNLTNTQFINPIGLDDEGHFSTAHDLAILTKYALHNKDFRRIVKMQSATIKSTNGQIVHAFENTNYLLNSQFLEILGVKTGTTEEAGPSVINLARGPKGQEVIAIILNSSQRFTENKRLIEWSFRNYSW